MLKLGVKLLALIAIVAYLSLGSGAMAVRVRAAAGIVNRQAGRLGITWSLRLLEHSATRPLGITEHESTRPMEQS